MKNITTTSCINTCAFAALIALSSAAMAQKPTESQVLNNADTQNREAVDAKGVHKSQKEYFKSIDRDSKGYLSTDDVSADPFLSQNYAKCDADHDGKLTWIEFKACTRNNPPSQ